MDGRATHMVLGTAALSAFALLLAGPAAAYVPEGDGVHAVGAQSQVRQQAQSVEPGTIPYLSQGVGVDKSQFAGAGRGRDVASLRGETPAIPYLSHGLGVDKSQFAGGTQVDAQHQALALNRDAKSSPVGLDPAIRTAIEARSDSAQVGQRATAPLPHGIQVVMSPASEEPRALGLTGDSGLTRSPDPGTTPSQTAYPSHVIGAGGSQWDGRTLPAAADVGSAQTPQLTATSSGSDFDWESFGAGAGMAALLAAGCAGLLLATRRRHTVGMS